MAFIPMVIRRSATSLDRAPLLFLAIVGHVEPSSTSLFFWGLATKICLDARFLGVKKNTRVRVKSGAGQWDAVSTVDCQDKTASRDYIVLLETVLICVLQKMFVNSVAYENTFSPALRAAYDADTQFEFMFRSLDGATIDDWIQERGDAMFPGVNRKELGKVCIVLRSYWNTSNGGRVFTLPDASATSWTSLLRVLEARDIVGVCGESIVNGGREEIARLGPEFYVILNVPEPRATLPEARGYTANKDEIIREFVRLAALQTKDIIADAVVSVKTRKQARALLTRAANIVKKALARSIQCSVVPARQGAGTTAYTTAHIGTMILTDHPELRTAEGAVTKLQEHMYDTMGADICSWIGSKIPTMWSEIHQKGTSITPSQERDLVDEHIGQSLRETRSHLCSDVLRLLSGMSIRRRRPDETELSIGQQSTPPVKKRPRQRRRAKLYDDIGAACTQCGMLGCEDAKNRGRIGKLLQWQNTTKDFCPKNVYDQYIQAGGNFAESVSGLKKLQDPAKGVTMVIVKPIGANFSPREHMFSMKLIRKVHTHEGTPLRTKIRGTKDLETKYNLIGNSLVTMDEQQTFMEHTEQNMPNVLFLLQVPE